MASIKKTKKKSSTKKIASGNFQIDGKPGDRSRSTRQRHKGQEVKRQDLMIKYMRLKKA